MTRDLAYYISKTLENVRGHSRTLKGTLDLSSSPDKPKAMSEGLTGEKAASLAEENIVRAVIVAQKYCWRCVSQDHFSSFLGRTADTVNRGIVKAGVRFRTGSDSDRHPEYGAVADLHRLFGAFAYQLDVGFNSLFVRKQTGDESGRRRMTGVEVLQSAAFSEGLVALAALAEWKINLTDHYFADGCGKISKVVAAFILMHGRLPLPNYPAYRQYYDLAPSTRRPLDISEVDDQEFLAFLAQYRTWVPLNG